MIRSSIDEWLQLSAPKGLQPIWREKSSFRLIEIGNTYQTEKFAKWKENLFFTSHQADRRWVQIGGIEIGDLNRQASNSHSRSIWWFYLDFHTIEIVICIRRFGQTWIRDGHD